MNKPLYWGYQYFIIWFIVSYQKFILFSPLWYFIRYQTHVMCHGDIKMPVMTKNNKYVCVGGCACVIVHGVCSQMFCASVKNYFLHLKS